MQGELVDLPDGRRKFLLRHDLEEQFRDGVTPEQAAQRRRESFEQLFSSEEVSSFIDTSSSSSDCVALPCGRCLGCRLRYTQDWAVRCVHEAQMHSSSSFLTLTYSPEHLPEGGDLYRPHLKKFMKDLRWRLGSGLSFFSVGEYGAKYLRPHYHVLLFGTSFPDRKFFKKTAVSKIYTSDFLSSLWPYGFSSLGDVTFASAAYSARYSLKKVGSKVGSSFYRLHNGEKFLVPEFTGMSLRPALGARWFEKFWSDVFPGDFVVHDGRKFLVPRYYDKLLQRSNPGLYNLIKEKRWANAVKLASHPDNTYARLQERELCLRVRISKCIREFENEGVFYAA